MSPDIIILLLGLVALMALGIPICFAMMSVASVILLVFYGSGLLNVLNAAFVYQMQSESLLAIPMFALMAAFLQTSGIGGDIYEFFHKWLGGINGGLAMATVATTAVIAAMSGVAATATIMMGLIALPAMLDPCGELGKISGAARAALLILCTRPSGLFCGQASRPAIRRLQFWAEARPHFCGQRTKDRERERAFAKYANYDAVDKEAFFLCH